MKKIERQFGFVALCGAPNAGKSTLLNQLLGEKIAAVSSKPQTTRANLLCVKEYENAQIAFVDSPGLFKPSTALGNILLRQSVQAFKGADIVVLVADLASRHLEQEHNCVQKILERYINEGTQVLLALNKIDLLKSGEVIARAATFQNLEGVKDFFLISASNGENVETLLETIVAHLPHQLWGYPPQSELRGDLKTWMAEQTREKVFEWLHEEIPYQAYVETISLQEDVDGLHIFQNIVVAKESQKRIVVGKKGATIRNIGEAARKALIHQLNRRIQLHLFVKVQEDWMLKPQNLKDAGLE